LSDVLIKVDNVSKKFAKNLKKSLYYGFQDVWAGLSGRSKNEDLRKDEFWAVRNISFEVKRGECLGLIGHNGAGKSTLLKMLNGLISPDTGSITMKGKIGALIELGAGFNPILTGRENIYNNGAVIGFSKAEIKAKLNDIIAFAELEEFIDMPVQNYSSGMRVRLGFAIAAQMEPDILLIDEVLAVGDLAFKMKCLNFIRDNLIGKVAIILVSHSVIEIMRLSTKVLVLERGKNIHYGNLEIGVGKYNNLAFKNKNESSNVKVDIKKSEYATNEDIDFLLNINSDIEVLNARIIFHLEYSNFRLSSLSTKFSGFDFNLNKGKNEILFSIKNNPLLVGGYVAIFDVYGPKIKDFITSSSPIEILITSPKVDYYGFGQCHNIQLKHEFKEIK
jgi:lipopolysaccharide transport system ATP-binding protein